MNPARSALQETKAGTGEVGRAKGADNKVERGQGGENKCTSEQTKGKLTGRRRIQYSVADIKAYYKNQTMEMERKVTDKNRKENQNKKQGRG